MPLLPDKPDNVDEQAAEPIAVDYPDQQDVLRLPAETTTAEGIEDTGYIWDETYPGDEQPMPKAAPAVLTANRVTIVSDTVVFGSSLIGVSTPAFILVPAHRDRLRVTIQAAFDAATPPIYIGHGPDIQPGEGWALLSNVPVTFETRDAIYACSGPAGANTTRIQWAIELVSEGRQV